MNVPAAIRCINDALELNEDCMYNYSGRIGCHLRTALKLLQPQRYVLHNKPGGVDLLYAIDTQHPDYREDIEPVISHPWVVLRWTGPGEIERQKARAIVEHLNSTAT